MRRIYLDHSTTTPVAPEVRRAMIPYLSDAFGAPSSPHAAGAAARQALQTARERVAALLQSPVEEIIFTGSATEANNLALKGLAMAAGPRRRRIVATATEHISILHPLKTLGRGGHPVTLLPVGPDGTVDPDRLRSLMGEDTLLVSVAHASAEIGTVQPLAEIGRVAHAKGALLHTDATLTAGALPLPRGEWGPDLITVTPHLFYGPKGVGALRVRQGIRLAPLIEGGAQEGGIRAGTEDVAAIVGFGAAAALCARQRGGRTARAEELARTFLRSITERLDGAIPTGHPVSRVPGHLSFCVRGVEAEALLRGLEEAGIDAGSGSACTTEVRKASHVLEAIGVDAVLARGALTVAFGEANRDGDARASAAALVPVVERLRSLSPFLDP